MTTQAPEPKVLYCPRCENCGKLWRPSNHPTVGVAYYFDTATMDPLVRTALDRAEQERAQAVYALAAAHREVARLRAALRALQSTLVHLHGEETTKDSVLHELSLRILPVATRITLRRWIASVLEEPSP